MYDDNFNPLGIQGGGVHPPHEWTFFCNFETAPVNKVSLIFSSQNHTPLWLLSMLQWLILNCNQTLQVNFLAYYNNLVSQVRDLMRPWNFWKYFSLTNEVYWWNRSHFWWQVLLNCAPRPSSIHLYPAPSTSTQLISTSTQLISVSTQLSGIPSIFGPKYCR